ncbi:thiolase family protein [Curtobacterium sp. RRHDQ10]|uniref:thiolase family protein n=1 Tax=Curtobacterium phyllosphaerae TaxID=3413379 RepID=UPI003BEFC275
MTKASDVVFVDGVRTPFGRAGEKGVFWNTRADDLATHAMRGLLDRNASLDGAAVDDVAVAATTQQGDQGLTLGRTVGMLAGLPKSVPGYAIDRMCAGAMTSVTTLAGAIAFGAADIAIAGGVEHMGRHPMGFGADPNPRFLAERMVAGDALVMGNTAERLHDRFPAITKDRTDAYALRSQQRYQAAWEAGKHQPDIIPVATATDSGWDVIDRDEPPRPGTTLEALAALKTPFRPHGRVTAGNAAGLNDGSTMALLASTAGAAEHGLGVKMRMVSFAFAGVDPEVMGVGPVPATDKALRKAGLTIDDIGLFEINEAFAVQVLAFLDNYGIPEDSPDVNPWGGAIAVGHPLASSGVRLMSQLAAEFAERPDVQYGITTMCIGLGQGGTVIWENPHHSRSAARAARSARPARSSRKAA